MYESEIVYVYALSSFFRKKPGKTHLSVEITTM